MVQIYKIQSYPITLPPPKFIAKQYTFRSLTEIAFDAPHVDNSYKALLDKFETLLRIFINATQDHCLQKKLLP